MNMENFLSWDILLTFSGCVAGTVFLTEWLKRFFSKVPTQLTSFIIAALILIVGHFATGTFAWIEVPLYLVNAVAVSLSANGGFDILNNAFNKKKEPEDELVLDGNNTYLNLSQEPEKFLDGEIVEFKVKKITSQE